MTPELFLQISDPLPEPTLLVLGNGVVLVANRASEKQLGIAANAIRGHHLSELVSEPSERVIHYLRACSRSRDLVYGSLTVKNKNQTALACRAEGAVLRPRAEGAEALILLRLVPKQSAAEKFVALNKRIEELGKEIHRRKRAEEAIRQQEEWSRVTLTSIGDAVIATDVEGRVTFMNAMAETLTGWSQVQALGRLLPEVFHIVNEQTHRQAEPLVRHALREGKAVGPAKHTRLIARDGTERPIDDSAAPMRGDTGGTIGSVLVFRDVSERNRAEQDRIRLASIVESSEDAIVSKTLDGIIQTWNIGAERLFGYSQNEAIGQPITLIVPPELIVEERVILQRLHRGERIEHFETVRVTKDGRRLDISLTVSPLRDAEGRIIGASKVARDVTERKRARVELQASEQRYRTLFESMGEGFCVVQMLYDSDGRPFDFRFLEVNPKFETHTGLKDAVGHTILELVPGHDAHWFVTFGRVAETGEAIRFSSEAKAMGRWYDVYAYRAGGSDTCRVAILFTDITDRKRAEKELARVTSESERLRRLYETILSATPDFVYVFSLDYRVLYANESLVEMWGRGREGAIGKTFLEIGYEAWHAEMHCREIDQVRTTRKPIRGEVPYNGTKGRRIYDYIFVPVFGADGEVEAVAGTTRDVTDRQAMEQDLRESDRKKDDLIALLAHELRNPLAPIRNGLQVMRLAGEDADSVNRARTMMDRQLTHMVRLVDDLLDVSRINRNKMELRWSRVSLTDVVSSAVETVRPLTDELGHELTISLPAVPVHLNADMTRLSQVFSNLLTNSAKYTPPGGRIWLSAERADSQVTVSVRDTGIGIPLGSLIAIFGMFSQVDRSIERSAGGLGIGLALVKGLVEMHGGTVSAASAGEGQGSTFTVTLPVLTQSKVSAGEQSDTGQVKIGSSHRILVVDDNRDGAESLSEMLLLLGNEVHTAHDGVEAIEQTEQFRPEVILMDVGMPRLNGLDATRRIREQPWGKSLTIIALTGWGQESDREQSRAAGCDGHLVKPVNLADLERLLQAIKNTV